MKIDHVAFWVEDLEAMRYFYLTHFEATCGERYMNPVKKFYSYFITFNDGGSRIELMHRADIAANSQQRGFVTGIAHLALTVGNRERVDAMIAHFRAHGYKIIGEPRVSGDGYYEGVILDPEENVIELLAEN
ncbi:VOC family protein [Chitinophaga pinensis]|uniref:Glyoxalase/bleomycin resistance protein/dioxygenase n=1 Tax=Chitinophaga pinensis (strain ATCC 43595 / DSM 2588 / LMG 13176 / NBRC 15968 / NCIMB 11800 / UQM 2034) TaxID=485918 RepID=A0A979GQS3_CHIPD|nr:VOC family protein [Chitinophaga pinensis]ACU61792.1 Glyoxalase/bleomycin resistance protein/dioxygenase [Chitinophaga pinensis DSM 2588]